MCQSVTPRDYSSLLPGPLSIYCHSSGSRRGRKEQEYQRVTKMKYDIISLPYLPEAEEVQSTGSGRRATELV